MVGGRRVGVVTSGTHSPTLGVALGLAYLEPGFAEPGSTVEIDVRGRAVAARVVPVPFYKRAR